MQMANMNIDGKGIYFTDKQGKKLDLPSAAKKILNRFYNYYLDAALLFLWVVGYIPSHLIRNFFYQLCGIEMGKGSTFHMGARFYQPRNISIGEGTIIGDHAFLDGRASLKIGSHVDIASKVMIYNSEHDLNSPTMKAKEEPVVIGDYCFIGPRAIIMPGVTLGKGAVVAGGAVVTKSVPDGVIVGGVPAQKIKDRGLKEYSYRLGRPRLFQ
jgi:acetyltransferase-like isoleucine patch superfamily enzyme